MLILARKADFSRLDSSARSLAESSSSSIFFRSVMTREDPTKVSGIPSVSYTHLMMGQIDEWFFNSLAGIRTVEGKPGMKEIEIRPRPVGDLTYVRARCV